MTNPIYYFPNRKNAWGQYSDDGSKTFTAKGELTNELLDKHLKGEITMGLHSTNPETNTCKWGYIDIDFDNATEEDIKKAINIGQVVHDILLTDYGVKGWIDFSGKKGVHVGFKCKEIDASYVFNLLMEVKRKAEERLDMKIGGETYPKQPTIPIDGYGNWIKMPLSKHRTTKKLCVLIDSRTGEFYNLETSIKELTDAPINIIPRLGGTIISKEYENKPVLRVKEKIDIDWSCIKALIKKGTTEGNRHYSMMIIVHHCWSNGWQKEESKILLHEFNDNCDQSKPKEEIDREFEYQWHRCESNHAYKIGCKGSGLISQILTSFCPYDDKSRCVNPEVRKTKIMEKNEKKVEEDFKEAVIEYSNQLELGRKFIEKQPIIYDKSKVWWLWEGGGMKWKMVDEIDVLRRISNSIQLPYLVVESKQKNEMLESLKHAGRGYKIQEFPKTWVQFKNKIVDILSGEEFDPSPKYFCTNPIPWEIGDSDNTPIIDRIFEEWVGIQEIIKLKEIIAYCMLSDYPLHRIFALIGSGSNGKGCFLTLLNNFIGIDNIISTSLERLVDSRFEISKLYRKLAAIMGETNVKLLDKTDLLKRASGGDTIPGEFKGKQLFDFTNYAKIIIASNSLPSTKDKTEGFYRRWMVIDFRNKFDEKTDILSTIPEYEYNNLARQCVRILKRIITNREFTREGTVEDRKRLYEEKSNPTLLFLNESFVKDIHAYVAFPDFYSELKEYLLENDYRLLSNSEVSKVLRNDGYDIKTATKNKRNARYIFGIKKKMTQMTQMTQNPTSLLRIGKKWKNDNLGNSGNSMLHDAFFNLESEKVVTEELQKQKNGYNRKELVTSIAFMNKWPDSALEAKLDKLIADGKIHEVSPGVLRLV